MEVTGPWFGTKSTTGAGGVNVMGYVPSMRGKSNIVLSGVGAGLAISGIGGQGSRWYVVGWRDLGWN